MMKRQILLGAKKGQEVVERHERQCPEEKWNIDLFMSKLSV